MGADLYIKKLYNSKAADPDRSKAYFRDSYNMGNVLWTLGLSWWIDVLPLLDEKLQLKGENLLRFRDRVVNAGQHLPSSQELREKHAVVTATGEESIENWHRHYVTKRQELIAFLDRAIENHSSIICSL